MQISLDRASEMMHFLQFFNNSIKNVLTIVYTHSTSAIL